MTRIESKQAVGIRELRDTLSATLRRVRGGQTIAVTDRGRAVALIVPVRSEADDALIASLVAAGRLSHGGGKPQGTRPRIGLKGGSVADAVIEDRR